jgi:hypothetical protein
MRVDAHGQGAPLPAVSIVESPPARPGRREDEYNPPSSKSLTGFPPALALRIAVSVSGMTVTLLAAVRLTVNVTAGYRRMSMDTTTQS